MYFKEKEDTNIDKEFENERKFDFRNIKPIYWIISGIVLLVIIIIIVIMLFLGQGDKYTIELVGEERIVVTKDGNYIEPGYKAYDRKNNDVTTQVKVTGNIDTSKVGEYEILYSIGGITQVRYIIVTEGDTYIYLKGKVNMYLEVGDEYVEPGYQVYDSADQNLTEKVKITGNVDTSKAGTYQLTYSVTNSRNITITEKRTIIVMEKNTSPKK